MDRCLSLRWQGHAAWIIIWKRRLWMQKIGFDQLELNPFTVIGSDCFLLTAGSAAHWNTMTAGWGGLGYLWNDPAAFVFVRRERYTLQFMETSGVFTLSFFPPERKSVLDYCGSVSGRDADKAKGAGLTPVALDGGIAFEEANLILTCAKTASMEIDGNAIIDDKVRTIYPQEDWHRMYAGRILGVYVN